MRLMKRIAFFSFGKSIGLVFILFLWTSTSMMDAGHFSPGSIVTTKPLVTIPNSFIPILPPGHLSKSHFDSGIVLFGSHFSSHFDLALSDLVRSTVKSRYTLHGITTSFLGSAGKYRVYCTFCSKYFPVIASFNMNRPIMDVRRVIEHQEHGHEHEHGHDIKS